MSIGRIARMTLRDYLIAYGTVEAEPASDGKPPASASVAAQLGGLITEARCEEGQKVRRGQELFSLDHRLADAQVEKARTVVALAEKNLQRKISLSNTGNVSQKLLEEAGQLFDAARQDLALANTQRALLQVEAPLNGTLVGSQHEWHGSVIPAGIAGIQCPRTKTESITSLCSEPRQSLPG
ncbi:MAG: efflux RND transporter periplasmic adaptor subunit [Methylococcales bacterium]